MVVCDEKSDMAIVFWFAFFHKIPPKSLSVLVDDFEGRILFEIGFQTKIDQQEGPIRTYDTPQVKERNIPKIIL